MRRSAGCASIKREIGINVVVTRHNFAELDADLRVRDASAGSPRSSCSGSSRRAAARARTTSCAAPTRSTRAFLPTILAAAKRHRVRVKVDCSYTPMLAHHQPDRALLAELCVYGCTGGDFLIGAKPDGRITACSFAAPPPELVQIGKQRGRA